MTNHDYEQMKTVGIAAHSYEGGTLSFLTACRKGAAMLGPHMHPNIVVSAIPMGLSMDGWENDHLEEVIKHHENGIEQVRKAGADFFICPDNTSHIVLNKIIDHQKIPGLSIAQVVCHEIQKNGWKKVGLLGTKWTMTGPVYPKEFESCGLEKLIPNEDTRMKINEAIFEELCQSTFKEETIQVFVDAIKDLKEQGAECVVLGCTEIPLIINQENSALPILDSTRLQAEYAVQLALSGRELPKAGWVKP